MLKLHLLTFLSVISLSTVFSATIDDAKKALDDLEQLSLQYQEDLRTLMHNLEDSFSERLSEMMIESSDEVAALADELKTNIDLLAERTQNATGVNTTSCVGSAKTEIDQIREDMMVTLEDCYGSLLVIAINLMDVNRDRFLMDYDAGFGCCKMSFEQCSQYEDEACADSVLEQIEAAKVTMDKTFQLIKADSSNKLEGRSLTCKQMVAEKMTLIPVLISNFVEGCLETFTIAALPPSCQ